MSEPLRGVYKACVRVGIPWHVLRGAPERVFSAGRRLQAGRSPPALAAQRSLRCDGPRRQRRPARPAVPRQRSRKKNSRPVPQPGHGGCVPGVGEADEGGAGEGHRPRVLLTPASRGGADPGTLLRPLRPGPAQGGLVRRRGRGMPRHCRQWRQGGGCGARGGPRVDGGGGGRPNAASPPHAREWGAAEARLPFFFFHKVPPWMAGSRAAARGGGVSGSGRGRGRARKWGALPWASTSTSRGRLYEQQNYNQTNPIIQRPPRPHPAPISLGAEPRRHAAKPPTPRVPGEGHARRRGIRRVRGGCRCSGDFPPLLAMHYAVESPPSRSPHLSGFRSVPSLTALARAGLVDPPARHRCAHRQPPHRGCVAPTAADAQPGPATGLATSTSCSAQATWPWSPVDAPGGHHCIHQPPPRPGCVATSAADAQPH